MCQKSPERRKVGDTLTATVAPAGAKVTYSWSINGIVYATSESITVPASAKDGDEIKLVVTDADGEKAEDTVYVGGLTILKVEPLAQGETYKYVKAYFSKALDSLSPSEIEIRGKKDQKLYSIQTAVLSADGMSADLTLYGTADADRTTFLLPGTTYVMTLTQNGQSTSLEFELPAYATDKIVTSVDTTNNKITVNNSWKTGEAPVNANGFTVAWNDEEFKVAGKYAGNLGTLIGRTVNFQYDTDMNLTAFNVDEAEVVYGAMQYVNDDANNELKDGYYKDKITGAKYKNSATATSTKNVTQVFDAKTGDYLGAAPEETTYQYVKLVLNPDGTVSTAFILETLELPLFVTEVDGTKVIQDDNNGADLDGYIIVKDDKYITPEDLELGDVVFVNLAKKFADVYNNEISGEISNVISGKLDIDGKTYNWNGAQYYDEADDKYKTLSTKDTKNEASQNYLNSLDPDEDTTIWIARNGDIKYLAGTETGVVNTTDVTYLLTAAAKGYTESLKSIIQLKVFDGTDTDTLALKLDDLKYYNGVAGKFTATQTDATPQNVKAWNGDVKDAITFTATKAADNAANVVQANGALAALFEQGELVKVTYDESGKAIGIDSDESTGLTMGAGGATLDNKNDIQTSSSNNLTKDTKMVTTVKNATTDNKFSTGSYTNLWIINQNNKVDENVAQADKVNKDDTYSMTALTDFTNEIVTTDAAAANDATAYRFVSMAIRTDGTKATDLVVTILNDKAYKDAETNTINGMLTGVTKKNNSDNNTQVINTIKIIGTDGVAATYYGDGTLAEVTGAKDGDYVTLTQNKNTGLISAATMTDNWQYVKSGQTEDPAKGQLLEGRDYDATKLVLANGDELTYAAGGSLLLRYTEEGSVKHKVVTYSDINTDKRAAKVWYNKTYLNSTGDKIQSDMIVVEFMDQVGVAEITLNAPANTGFNGTVGSATVKELTVYDPPYTVTYGLQSSADQVNWADIDGHAITNTSGVLSIAGTVTLTPGTFYRVKATTTDPAWGTAYSNVVSTAAAVLTSAKLAKDTGTAAAHTSGTASADTLTANASVKASFESGVLKVGKDLTDTSDLDVLTCYDQFGNVMDEGLTCTYLVNTDAGPGTNLTTETTTTAIANQYLLFTITDGTNSHVLKITLGA